MWLLLFAACTTWDCGRGRVGMTREEATSSFRDSPGETGHHTLEFSGDTLTVTVTGIPDDSVSGRSMWLTFAPDTSGVDRVTTCAARDQCARGFSLGACP